MSRNVLLLSYCSNFFTNFTKSIRIYCLASTILASFSLLHGSNPAIGWQIGHETFAKTPKDRSRLTVGVGEEVTLTAPCPADWVITKGGGTVNPAKGTTTVFCAPARADTVTITATLHINGSKQSITFEVIEPTGVTIKQRAGTNVKHTKDTVSAGFQGSPITILPLTVSFYNIQYQEQKVAAVTTGFYNFWQGIEHAQGIWIDVDEDNTQDNTIADIIWSGDPDFNTAPNPNTAGTLIWDIPWKFRVPVKNDAGGKQFTIVQHKQEVDNAGKCTISKGGTSKSANLADPTSDYE